MRKKGKYYFDLEKHELKNDAPIMKSLEAELRKALARKIKDRRLFAGFTIEGMAIRTGIPARDLESFETPNGKKVPSIAQLWRLANAVEGGVDHFFSDRVFGGEDGLMPKNMKRFRFDT